MRLAPALIAIVVPAFLTACADIPSKADVDGLLDARNQAVCVGRQLRYVETTLSQIRDPVLRASRETAAADLAGRYGELRAQAVRFSTEVAAALKSPTPKDAKTITNSSRQALEAARGRLADDVAKFNAKVKEDVENGRGGVEIVLGMISIAYEVGKALEQIRANNWESKAKERTAIADAIVANLPPEYRDLRPASAQEACQPLDPPIAPPANR